LALKTVEEKTHIMVLPITCSAPKDNAFRIQIPKGIKRYLGMDEEPLWVVISEVNEFIWPGYDLRTVSSRPDGAYGFIPPQFFKQIREELLKLHRRGQLKRTNRSGQ
jgi:hypothetical protein